MCLTCPGSAELCSRARQLGLSGEAAAAEQTLAERKQQASRCLTAAASTGNAASYQAAVLTAEAAAAEASMLASAEATFTARCTAAAEALSTAAESGGWTQFASAREGAAFLQQAVRHAEAVMSQRRGTASTAVAAAVDHCIEGLLLEPAWMLASKRVHEHEQPTAQFLSFPCSECSGLMESAHLGSGTPPPLQGAATSTGLFQGSVSSSPPGRPQCIISAVTLAMSAMHLDAGKPDWTAAVTALSDMMPHAKAAIAVVRGQPIQSSPAGTLAAAFTEASHLGLQQTLELALQTLLTQAKLQLQSHQAVVAEFDLPTDEHPQELCTTAWQHPRSLQQIVPQDAVCMPATSQVAEAHLAPPAEALSSAGLNPWATYAAETESEQAQVSRQLVAKLQAGEHLGVLYRLHATLPSASLKGIPQQT